MACAVSDVIEICKLSSCSSVRGEPLFKRLFCTMSTRAKMTLGASIVLCCGTIYGVHYLQIYEKEVNSQAKLFVLIFKFPLTNRSCKVNETRTRKGRRTTKETFTATRKHERARRATSLASRTSQNSSRLTSAIKRTSIRRRLDSLYMLCLFLYRQHIHTKNINDAHCRSYIVHFCCTQETRHLKQIYLS